MATLRLLDKTGSIITLEITMGPITFTRKFNYRWANRQDFLDWLNTKLENLKALHQTIQGYEGQTVTHNETDYAIGAVSFSDGFVFLEVNGKKVCINNCNNLTDVKREVYRQTRG